MGEVVIADAKRTPHGALLGQFEHVAAVDLGATAVHAVLEHTEVSPDAVDWVNMGHSIQAGTGQVPARQAALKAGVPEDVPATTVNEASGSGLRAITQAVDRIHAGRNSAVVAGGMESMSNAPYMLPDYRHGKKHGDSKVVDLMVRDALWDMLYDAHMGRLTEDLVSRYDVSREAQDRYSLESHENAVTAIENKLFMEEIVPVPVNEETVGTDEGPRPDTSMDKLAELKPFFKDAEDGGTVTAGNASDLSDGAAATLVTTREEAQSLDTNPLASVVDYTVSYTDAKWFPLAVEDAVKNLLQRNEVTVADVDVFEINEAFAAHMVHFMDELGVPRDKLNVRGGAVALGHPIGASGGILTTTVTHTMKDEGYQYGVVGMCVGGGGGIAMLLRR